MHCHLDYATRIPTPTIQTWQISFITPRGGEPDSVRDAFQPDKALTRAMHITGEPSEAKKPAYQLKEWYYA
jgi:hypothetical protein